MNPIAQEYEQSSIKILELATKYRKSCQQITDLLKSELGPQKFSTLTKSKRGIMPKTTKATKTTKTEESEFFKVNDRVQWFNPDGPRVIGVITKVFKEKCWIQPAGADGVGEELKGVLLDQIELYSDAPGPIEEMIAQLNGTPTPGEEPAEQPEKQPKENDSEDFDLSKYVDEAPTEPKCQDWQFEEKEEVIEDKSESDDFGLFWLPIAAVEEHQDFQPRGNAWQSTDKGISSDVVEQYAEWLNHSEPPAIEVWHGQIGDEEGWWLLSGHHRIRALLKAGRDQVQCFQKATNYEDAIYRAAISNAGGGDRTRQIYKMSRNEWGEACKSFLRVCDRLSEEATREFLDEAVAITGKSKSWNKLNDSAIAAVFGISRGSVQNYQKQIELEKAAAEFPKGTRVLLTHYTELQLLGDRKYRLGVVENFDATRGLRVGFDYYRGPNGYFQPKDLLKVDDPIYEKPTKLKVGDRVWKQDEGNGVVVSVTPEPAVSWLKKVDEEYPLICWEDGSHTAHGLYSTDFEGSGEALSIEEQLLKIKQYLSNNSEDEAGYLWDYMIELQNHLQSLLGNEANAEEEIATSVTQEEKNQRKELLGRSLPAGGGGMNGSELPDKSTTNGKHPENPEHTAIGPLERPAEATGLEQARAEARKSAALNRYNDLIFDLEVIPDEGLKELIKLAKSELTKRHRPAQEGD